MSDASCRLLSVFFDILDEMQIPHEALVADTELDLVVLRDERSWISWDALCLLSGRMSDFVGGDERLHELAAERIMGSSSYQIWTPIVQALASPRMLYRATVRWISAQLFSMVDWEYAELGPRTITVTVSYGDQYAIMPQMAPMIGATMVALPTILALPRAEVTPEEDGRRVRFRIRLSRERTLWSWLVRIGQAIFAPGAVTVELERQADDLRAKNQALEAARCREAQVSEARYRFLTTISHELRTPLNGILGSTQVLLPEPLPDGQREMVEAAHSAASDLQRLIDGILDFNRIHAGEVLLDAEPFDLCALITASLEDVRPRLRVTGRLDVPDGPRWVRGDARWLGRALHALLDNAARLTDDGSVVIAAEPGEGDRWCLSVTDTGPGMSAAQQAQATISLQRDDHSSGLGLGLALVRHIMHAMGGAVDIESLPGAGTCVRLALSLPPATPPAAAATQRSGGGACILVVEDNPINQLVTQRLLGAIGYTSVVAEDGAVGVRVWQGGSFAAVLMDCNMPVMDGHAATREIRALEAGAGRIPIIALTAHASDEDRRRAFAAGMDRYLTKPVERAQLAAALGEFVCLPGG